ncbi:hypothetical protein [Streptomyces mirabilis]|uniref:hypothetical protein n=1 Tax=Streptomyces mirabilis TaxID=68239 RepID=UPI0033ABEAC5
MENPTLLHRRGGAQAWADDPASTAGGSLHHGAMGSHRFDHGVPVHALTLRAAVVNIRVCGAAERDVGAIGGVHGIADFIPGFIGSVVLPRQVNGVHVPLDMSGDQTRGLLRWLDVMGHGEVCRNEVERLELVVENFEEPVSRLIYGDRFGISDALRPVLIVGVARRPFEEIQRRVGNDLFRAVEPQVDDQIGPGLTACARREPQVSVLSPMFKVDCSADGYSDVVGAAEDWPAVVCANSSFDDDSVNRICRSGLRHTHERDGSQ